MLIDTGVEMLYDATSSPRLGVLRIAAGALLEFEDSTDASAPALKLSARTVLVYGVMRVGSPNALFQRQLDLEFVNDQAPPSRIDDQTEILFQAPVKIFFCFFVVLFLLFLKNNN